MLVIFEKLNLVIIIVKQHTGVQGVIRKNLEVNGTFLFKRVVCESNGLFSWLVIAPNNISGFVRERYILTVLVIVDGRPRVSLRRYHISSVSQMSAPQILLALNSRSMTNAHSHPIRTSLFINSKRKLHSFAGRQGRVQKSELVAVVGLRRNCSIVDNLNIGMLVLPKSKVYVGLVAIRQNVLFALSLTRVCQLV